MKLLQNPRSKSKGNGTAPHFVTQYVTKAAVPLATTQRKSLFARQIWSVERKPGFARSSIYGYAR